MLNMKSFTHNNAYRVSGTRDGMTIVEVVIAVSIFAVCIAGMCALVKTARELSDRARDHYVAINIAKNRLERARTFEFDQLTTFIETDAPVDVSGNDISESSCQFQRTTTVSDVAVNLKEIQVTVEIRNRVTREFDTESETIKSLFAKYIEPTE